MKAKRFTRVAVFSACALCLAMCSGKKGGEDAGEDTDSTDVVEEDSTVTPDGEDAVDLQADTTSDEVSPDAEDVVADGEDAPEEDPASDGDDAPSDAMDAPEDMLVEDPVDDTALDVLLDTYADTSLDSTLDAGDEDGSAGFSVSGTVYRASSLPITGDPSSDGVGPLMIAFFRCEPFVDRSCDTTPLFVHASAGDVDLSDPSAGYPYSVTVDDWGELYILAVLDDDGSGFRPEPWLSVPVGRGDLSAYPPPRFVVPWTGGLTDADVTLDLRASLVSGQVTLSSGIGYSGDGTGNLHVGIVDRDPASGGSPPILLGNSLYLGVNLLDGTPENYSVTFLAPAGTVYGVALLDDDTDGMLSETGEPLTASGASLSVTSMGGTYSLPIVMDALAP